MIRSDFHGGRRGPRPGVTIGLVLWAAFILARPASACSQQNPCMAGVIDGFFLSLITTSLGKPGQGTTPPPVPFPADTPSPLPPAGRATVIKPPAPPETGIHGNPPVPSTGVTPVQQLTIGQTFVGGTFHEGGAAEIFLEFLPSTDMPPDAIHLPVTLSDLALVAEQTSPDLLTMEAIVSLPVGEAWPLQSLSQQLRMQVSCGACGPDGGISHLAGTGSLHIQTAPWGFGHITDISLQAPGGPTAHGEMHFILRRSDKAVFTDDEARMNLVVDGAPTELATRLVAWHGRRRAITGIFVGMPVGTGHDLGAFAGQFSGAGCDVDCGVEN